MSEAEAIYKLNLMNRIKALGINHIKTAVLFERLGDLCTTDRRLAYEHYNQASLIYEARLVKRAQSFYLQQMAGLYVKLANLLMARSTPFITYTRDETKDAIACLLKAIRIYDKLPVSKDQSLICYQSLLSCLIHQGDLEKVLKFRFILQGLQICDKIWLKIIQQKLSTPQRFDELFRQGFFINPQFYQKINFTTPLCLLTKGLSKDLMMTIWRNIENLIPDSDQHSQQIYQYQKNYQIVKAMLDRKESITPDLREVVNELSQMQTQFNPLTQNIIGFVGRKFFEDQLYSY